jgi:ketosteroid isomerase-like protein
MVCTGTRSSYDPKENKVSPEDVIRANFEAYLSQDRAACEALLDDNLAFTSPQDDHIDRQTFLERCFPTAGRVARQDLIHVTRASETDVFICYEYELKTGATHRNTELITVVDGRITEIQVFFGGAVA